MAGFTHQLQDLGWTDARNLRIDYRWAAGNPERMQTLAKELTALQPDVLFCRSTPVTKALLKQTRAIPIVFAVVSDPVGEGFVVSLARPGGNVTGFTNAESSLTGKWLGLLKEIMPSINRVAFIFDPKGRPRRWIVLHKANWIRCSVIRGGTDCCAGSRCRRYRARHRGFRQ